MVKICDTIYHSEKENEYNEKFKKYPFELDHFQKYAIEGIEKGKHILITAHTGSGKTLPSEYAIEKFCGEGKKVIYTSPIKSLSNQKYYEFSEKYPHISFGILTGDIKFNPEADCLIMTTEILRNTLFQKEVIQQDETNREKYNLMFEMDVENELGCVIFDEVHYINDANRGRIWEETIIKMPEQVQMVMLSATIDRSHEFATWIETIKQREVWLSSTNIRVVPLTHYTYYQMNQQIYKKTKDKTMEYKMREIDGKIIPIKEQHKNIDLSTIQKMDSCDYYIKKNRVFINYQHVINNIIKKLKSQNMLPAICFVFSRKKVEEYAEYIETSLFDDDESHIPNIIGKECNKILRKLPNHQEYTNMPEYIQMVKLLEKGIAIHHSGILPILREMVELLFSKGYIKLLFATETFAVGINMPTKTVLFTSLKKFDGYVMRYLLPHEYTQMAGRAGRRGLDIIGHVIHLNNMFDIPDTHTYLNMLCGKPQKLVSKFQIHFNIILKLLSTNNNQFHKFVQMSMMGDEIQKEEQFIQKEMDTLREKQIQYENTLKLCKTSIEDIQKVMELEEREKHVKPKKRKQIQRDIYSIIENNRTFMNDKQKYKDYIQICDELKKSQQEYDNCKLFIDNNIQKILYILSTHNFIELYDCEKQDYDEEQQQEQDLDKPNEKVYYKLTTKGIISNSIQEINGICLSDIIMKGYFDNLTPQQIASIMASFTNIRVSDEVKQYSIQYDDDCKNIMAIIKTEFDTYYNIELETIGYVDQDNYTIIYDINEEVFEWCNAENEAECKNIIGILNEKEIFVGEFVKALMKINNICSELENICDLIGNIKLKNSLSKIPDMTLKYIATNQSLYI
jgi:superfamily II RNA helicase